MIHAGMNGSWAGSACRLLSRHLDEVFIFFLLVRGLHVFICVYVVLFYSHNWSNVAETDMEGRACNILVSLCLFSCPVCAADKKRKHTNGKKIDDTGKETKTNEIIALSCEIHDTW